MKSNYFKYFIVIYISLFQSAMVQAYEINAVLDWSDKRSLGTTVNARVAAVNINVGDVVKEAELLLTLDDRYFKVKQREAISSLHHAKLLLEEAEKDQERAIELYDRAVLSEFERHQADIALAKEKSVFSKAKSAYDLATLDVEYSQIKAPFHSVILKVNTAVGEVIVNRIEANVLVEVARADEMIVRGFLSGEALSKLKVDQKVEVAFRGSWKEGVIKELGLEPKKITEKVRFYEILVRLPIDPSLLPRAGELSAIRLPE